MLSAGQWSEFSDGSGLPDWKIALQVDVVLRAKIDHLHDIAGQTEGQQPRTNHGADHSLKGNFLIHQGLGCTRGRDESY